jgi:hypothetical protein
VYPARQYWSRLPDLGRLVESVPLYLLPLGLDLPFSLTDARSFFQEPPLFFLLLVAISFTPFFTDKARLAGD